MPGRLETESLPHLQVRGPTAGPLFDTRSARAFIEQLVHASGVHDPTVLVINLEGRFPSAHVLYEMLVPLGRAIRSGAHGSLILVVTTPDPVLSDVIRSLAQTQDLPIFLARSTDEIGQAEPAARLSPSEEETLGALRRLGGRASVATLATATGIDHTAAGNRLANLDQRKLVFRVTRPRREGNLYLDPRVATPAEDPADADDIDLPSSMRSDVRVLASLQGRAPAAVLAEAWKEFIEKNRTQLRSEYEEVARMVNEGDQAAVGEYTALGARKRVRAKVKRQKNA